MLKFSMTERCDQSTRKNMQKVLQKHHVWHAQRYRRVYIYIYIQQEQSGKVKQHLLVRFIGRGLYSYYTLFCCHAKMLGNYQIDN